MLYLYYNETGWRIANKNDSTMREGSGNVSGSVWRRLARQLRCEVNELHIVATKV